MYIEHFYDIEMKLKFKKRALTDVTSLLGCIIPIKAILLTSNSPNCFIYLRIKYAFVLSSLGNFRDSYWLLRSDCCFLGV